MVLLHGGSPKGAELIAAKWADHRKVPQIAFKPDWTKHAKAAPFKRNDQMLDVLPIGVMVFPGTGIQDNLADKAKKLGIPVWKFGERRRVSAAAFHRKRNVAHPQKRIPAYSQSRISVRIAHDADPGHARAALQAGHPAARSRAPSS